nr:MAG TPA: hypothetical protein [Bacteriophage sp.]
MHVKNGANQNIKSHQLIGAKCRLIRRFWLRISKMMNGDIDILQSLKTALFMRGALVVHHGAIRAVMKMIIYHGNTQNWQREVIKLELSEHSKSQSHRKEKQGTLAESKFNSE